MILVRIACIFVSTAVMVSADDFRPHYHYVTPANWMNEPNGLIRIGSTWHMFYQTNPNGITFDNLSWGHATSPDLVNWTYQDIAIPLANGIFSYSGTTWYDEDNDTGLGTSQNPPYLAYYTGFTANNGDQDQRLAYSLDQGVSWQKYSGNPIISVAQEASPIDSTNGKESRDPKVFYHTSSGKWVMVLTHGGQKKASFWNSDDGLSWTWVSDLRATSVPGLPTGVGAWEVPDLFEIPIEGEAGTRWCLLITVASGSPAGGNGVIGILGSFDGVSFMPDTVNTAALWLDHGRDFDGVTSWENVPAQDGRRIVAGVMNSYGGNPPTATYKSIISIPRELKLKRLNGQLYLTQQPVQELTAAGVTLSSFSNTPLAIGQSMLETINGRGLDIELDFTPAVGSVVHLEVRRGTGEKTVISYDHSTATLSMDRTNSGNIGYHPDAGGVHTKALATTGNGALRLRVLVDESSVEVFGGEGEVAISNLIFPGPGSTGVSLYVTQNDVFIDSLVVRGLSPDAGVSQVLPEVVHHWSMESWTGDTLYLNGSVATHGIADSADYLGQGILDGFANDPNAASDPLYCWGPMEGTAAGLISSMVPPPFLLSEGYSSEGSFNFGVVLNDGGHLFYAQDQFGEEWTGDADGSWTQELFFRSSAVTQGASGTQQLIRREGLMVPTGDLEINQRSGALTLKTNDGGVARSLTIPANYLDMQWHYVVVRYSALTSSVSLTTLSEDGRLRTVSGGYNPVHSNANILIGRYDAEVRRFNGLIDEVRLSNALLADAQLLAPLNLVADTDMDGLPDTSETNTGIFVSQSDTGTDPNLSDTDGDQLSDGDEVLLLGTCPLRADTDGDTLSDYVETKTGVYLSVNDTGTDPLLFDTDGDTLNDGSELNLGIYVSVANRGTDPNDSDTDDDGLNDGIETGTGVYLGPNDTGTNPLLSDTDADNLPDGEELNAHATNPFLGDSDGDQISDGDEVNTYGTDPNASDSDGDELSDYQELLVGMNPLSDDSVVLDAILTNPYLLGLVDPESIEHGRIVDYNITVDQNEVLIEVSLEKSADLSAWRPTGESAELRVPLEEGSQFFRLQVTDPE